MGSAEARSQTHVSSRAIQITMKDWHSEEEIKAQLRELTNETRKLRNDLYQLIRPSKTLNPRAFMHEPPVKSAAQNREDTPSKIPKKDEEI